MIMRIRKRLVVASATREQEQRGFTLTEIAIVLGIIGLILGAIWVAAAAVYNNLRVSKATTDLLTITQNVRAMYATTSTVDAAANMPIPFTNIAAGATATYVMGNVFPNDMVSTNAAGTTYTVASPWGGSVDIESAQASNVGDSFSVNFDKVPLAACISFIESNTGNGRDSGLVQVATAASGALSFTGAKVLTYPIPAGTFPVSASGAETLCNANANGNVGFAFKLKG